MSLTEPSVFITNIIYSGVSFFLGFKLFKTKSEKSIKYWSYFFIFTGITTLAAAFYHGFQNVFEQQVIDNLKRSYQLGAGLASMFVVLSIIYTTFDKKIIKSVSIVVGIKFSIYAVFILTSLRDFVFVFIDYIPSLLFVIIVGVVQYVKTKSQSSKYIIIGMVIMIFGVLVQRSNYDSFRYLTHDDLFHIINTISMIYLYLGGRLLKDKTPIP